MRRSLVVLALAMLVPSLTLTARPANPFLGSSQAIAEGRDIFNQTCATWHGPDGAAGEMGPALGAPGDHFVFVGSYTNPTPTTTSASKGIYGFRFDSKTGTLSPLGLAAATVNPAHVWAHPNGRFLYAANWETGDKTVGDTVSAFAIDHKTGTLT